MSTFLLYSPLIIVTIFMIFAGIIIIHSTFFADEGSKRKPQGKK